MQPNGDWAVVSGKRWQGAVVVAPFVDPLTFNDPPESRDPGLIWSKSCSKGSQVERFARTITIPSPAAVQVDLGQQSRHAVSFGLTVNGSRVLTVTPRQWAAGDNQIKLSAGQVAHFREGVNRIQVEIDKHPDPPGLFGPCPFGVAFALEGGTFAHLAVSQPPQDHRYKKSRGLTINGAVSILNQGPGPVLDSRLTIEVGVDSDTGMLATVTPSTGRCSRSGISSTVDGGYDVDDTFACKLGTIGQGQSVNVQISVTMKLINPAADPNKDFSAGITWEARS